MKTLFIVFLITILFFTYLYPQNAEPFFSCDNSPEGISPYSLDKGKYKPESNLDGQYLRVLYVFVQFDDDNESSPYWQLNSLPDYADDIVEQVSLPNGGYSVASLSNYFEVMSNTTFDFIGDVYPELVHLTSASDYSWYSDANKDVIDAIDENVDFKSYDNWKFENGHFVFSERNADRIVDMMFIVYRNAPPLTFGLSGGVADLGGPWTKGTDDKVNIVAGSLSTYGSGVTINRGYNMSLYDIVILSAHEYGHYLFGHNHTDVSGLMAGSFTYYNGTYAMNSWERGK